ncbi:MAG: chemotaxis protein CheA [Pseudobdellovibrio sp.]
MDEFEKTLKLGFIEEALQLIGDFENLLLDLEKAPQNRETIDGVFRLVHNIKGSSKAVGFEGLGVFCHELETYMLEIKNGTKLVSKTVIDKLLFSKDVITTTLFNQKSDLDKTIDLAIQVAQLKADEVAGVPHEEVRQPEESPSASVEPSGEPASAISKRKTGLTTSSDESIRVNLKRVDHLINAVGELVVLQAVLREQVMPAGTTSKAYRVSEDLGKIIKEVQDLSMSLRMVPAKTLVQKLQRICRDTSTSLDKEVRFDIYGEDTEIDKTILDMISDPLVHLVRNAIDHGFETKEERARTAKASACELQLRISYEGGKLLIRIKDDGKGLDRDRITQKALEKGIIKPGATLSEQQINELIFAPGFSTKQNVTDVSGRGVGMDVVKTSVEALGGQIDIKTEPQKGTEFSIQLPLTLAIIDGMVVKIGSGQYVMPLAQVSETFRVEPHQLDRTSGDLFCLRGKDFPVFNLTKILNPKSEKFNGGIGILSHSGRFSFVALVEDIVGQQQIVIKQMGPELSNLRGYVGSAVLGDGKPALILDLTELVEKEKTQHL